MTATMTAPEFLQTFRTDLKDAVGILLAERSLSHASVLDKLVTALNATDRAGFVRAVNAAFTWALPRLPFTEGAEILLETLRDIRTAAQA